VFDLLERVGIRAKTTTLARARALECDVRLTKNDKGRGEAFVAGAKGDAIVRRERKLGGE